MKIGVDIRILARGVRTGVEEYAINLLSHLFLIEPENPHFPPMAPFVSRQHADGLYPLVDTATPRHILYSMFEENGFYRLDFFDQTFQSMAGGIAFPPMTCSVFIPVK